MSYSMRVRLVLGTEDSPTYMGWFGKDFDTVLPPVDTKLWGPHTNGNIPYNLDWHVTGIVLNPETGTYLVETSDCFFKFNEQVGWFKEGLEESGWKKLE